MDGQTAMAIILRSLQRGTDFNHADRQTDRQRTSEPTLSEIYVSSKCETNSAFLPSQVSTTAPSLSRSPPPSPSSVFGVPMLIRRRRAQRALVLIRERREREEQIFLLLRLLLSSRFGTVPIYLSIFCAMHFSAKLTPSLSPCVYILLFSFFSLLSMFLCTFPLHLSRFSC